MCYHDGMQPVQSKVTSQGQVSVPAAIRSLLNLTPGSVLLWTQHGDRVVVERAARHDTMQVHRALFGHAEPPPAKTQHELKQGIRQLMQRRHAGS